MTKGSTSDRVTYNKKDILGILRDLDVIVVSLDHIGSQARDIDPATAARWTDEFVIDWRVCGRLAKARAVLSKAFSTSLGPDDMDELERNAEDLDYWESDNRKPPVRPRRR